LSITYHNVARENLRRIKSEIINKLKGLEEKLQERPLSWYKFNETIDKLRNDSLNEFKSKIKKDEEFQKEYIEELSLFMDDRIYIVNIFNRDQLEALHKGIFDSLMLPLIDKLNKQLPDINQLNLENELKEIAKKYRERGIESPQLEKILNEEFLRIQKNQLMKKFGMKLDIKNFKNFKNIFISYSNANRNVVYKIAEKLKANFNVWVDIDNLKVGDNLYENIADGIRNSSLFICFISEEYCMSKCCTEELVFADNLKKKILLVMLQREAKNGVELKIAKLNTFYEFKPPNVFEPWSEDLYQRLIQIIFDLTQEVKIDLQGADRLK
jgi:hypothetical protein